MFSLNRFYTTTRWTFLREFAWKRVLWRILSLKLLPLTLKLFRCYLCSQFKKCAFDKIWIFNELLYSKFILIFQFFDLNIVDSSRMDGGIHFSKPLIFVRLLLLITRKLMTQLEQFESYVKLARILRFYISTYTRIDQLFYQHWINRWNLTHHKYNPVR